MTDIVESLRESCGLSSLDEERNEAADEIERLREEIADTERFIYGVMSPASGFPRKTKP